MSPGTAGDTRVQIQDRRELPFFMVRTQGLHAIRGAVAGPRRVRTIGFYALLCQLANEQRHTGQHRSLEFTYELLVTRAGVSKPSVKPMLVALETAGVIRHELRPDRERGTIVSIAHLLIQDGAFIPITVPMAERLANRREGGHLLRDLGLTLILLEFCHAQRRTLDGGRAEVTRSEIAERAGLGIDRVDECNRVLAAAGLLTIERRRASNGGRNLPSLYTVHEAPTTAASQGRASEPGGSENETDRAADQNLQGRHPEPTGPSIETRRAADENQQGGDSAIPRTLTPPSIARPRTTAKEKQQETLPSGLEDETDGGGESFCAPDHVCVAFIAAWAPALGNSPAAAYAAAQAEWDAAAARLLARHNPRRIREALAQMVDDPYVGANALTLPDFERLADKLIARRFLQRRATPTALATLTPTLAWPLAKQHLEQAIKRHGRDRRAAAIAELARVDPLLVTFVEQVRWATLCEQPLHFSERRYAELWATLTAPDPTLEEPAA